MNNIGMYMGPWLVRRATEQDVAAVLALFDEAIAWFTEIGNQGQWGTEPWSTQERQIARIREACALPGAWVAEDQAGRVQGALILGESMPYVPAATEPEVYVRVLICSRDPQAKGLGRSLLGFADDQARRAGVAQLRVDCYGGGTGALVRFYESCGYERLATFQVEDWPGQLLGRCLPA
ncbi:GNAT family N-acetyltransferase [Alcaligenes faecalis]|uniref:GNAT family N-acetyltransferase n=1 Tax=Alcaligenes faecalis TaxID=511 RepID=UPI001D173380|nr:GNAT family N-acetyltransferase [Alcaligenes faecalis]